MTTYKAIVTEKNSPCLGQVIANTKIGQYKGLSKEDFYTAIVNTTCWAFEIVEI